MAIISSATALSSDYYLSSYYRDNRSARKSSGRGELTTDELVYEDSRALKRAIKQLGKYAYSEAENSSSIRGSISAFATTYNNALSSSGKSSSSEMKRYMRQLKALAAKHSDALEDCGISVGTDGKLTVNENLLKASSLDTLKSVFSKASSDLLDTTGRISKRMSTSTYNILYTQMTGNGGKINIIL